MDFSYFPLLFGVVYLVVTILTTEETTVNDIASAVIVAGITASSTLILNIIKGNREKKELKMEHANIKEKIGTEHADIKASLKEKMGTEHTDIKTSLAEKIGSEHTELRKEHKMLGKILEDRLGEVQKYVHEETALRKMSSKSEIDFAKISGEILAMGNQISMLQAAVVNKNKEIKELHHDIRNLTKYLDEQEKNEQDLSEKLEKALQRNRQLEAMLEKTEEEWDGERNLKR